MRSGLITLALTGVACVRIAVAQTPTTTPLELSRLKGSVVIDGVPDEAAWRDGNAANGDSRCVQASGNAFVQYNCTTNRLDFNVRLRYAFAEGTDLWLVYNEGLDTDPLRDLSGVRSPTSLARTVLLKYTQTIGF